MAQKPSYIGTLNTIANGERGGYELFTRWAAKTSDKQLKKTLSIVAVREAEHSWAFEKRLCELGYSLKPAQNEGLAGILKIAGSKRSDEKKFHALGIGVKRPSGAEQQPDRLLGLLSDSSIDAQTGELLGRFICEERDSGRLLSKAYKAMQRRNRRKKAS